MVDDFLTYLIAGTCASAVFTLITFIVYFQKPELNNLHGSMVHIYLVCYFVHMFLFTIMFSVIKYYPKIDNPHLLCGAVLGTWYFFLAFMLWLNVLSLDCLDIWTNLWKSPSVVQYHDKADYQESRIIRYAIIVSGSLVPHSLAISCSTIWISDLSEFFRLLLIMAIWTFIGITICSTIVFIRTTVIITERDKEEKHFDDTVGIRHEVNKEWFGIYLKLFLAMEVPVILLAVLISCNILSAYVFATILAVLQGIVIFVIIVDIRMPMDDLPACTAT